MRRFEQSWRGEIGRGVAAAELVLVLVAKAGRRRGRLRRNGTGLTTQRRGWISLTDQTPAYAKIWGYLDRHGEVQLTLRAPNPPIENLLNKPNPSAAPDDDGDFADPFLAALGVCNAAPALTTLVSGCIIRNGSFVGGEVASGLVTPLPALVGIGIPVPVAEVAALVIEELPPLAVVAGVANEMEPLRR